METERIGRMSKRVIDKLKGDGKMKEAETIARARQARRDQCMDFWAARVSSMKETVDKLESVAQKSPFDMEELIETAHDVMAKAQGVREAVARIHVMQTEYCEND